MSESNAKLQGFRDALDSINDDQIATRFAEIKAVVENSEMLLPVMGQFSSGKSRLINNLLGRDVLPVRVTETTSYLTFIRYAEEAKAELVYEDGAQTEISLATLHDIYQDSDVDVEASLDGVQHIDVYINSEILEGGLVIVDTPGINSINQGNEDLTVKMMYKSSMAVYVVSGPIALSDLNFLQRLNELGIKLIFARTYMDATSESENAEQEMQVESALIKENFGDNRIVFLSNKENSEYFAGISELRSDIRHDLFDLYDENISAYVDQELGKLADNGLTNISENLSLLEQSKSDAVSAMTTNINALQSDLEKLQKKQSRKVETIEATESEVFARAKRIAKETLSDVVVSIDNHLTGNESAYEVERLLSLEIEKLHNRLQVKFNDLANEYLQTQISLEDYENNIEVPDFSKSVDNFLENITDVPIDNGEIEKLSNLLALKSEQLNEAKAQLNSLDDEIKSVNDEVSDLGVYQPRLVEKEGTGSDYEEAFAGIGKVADIALLFIPGTSIAETAKTGALAAKGALSAGRMAGVAEKGAQIAEKAGKVVQKVNEVKQGTGMNQMSGITGILDMLTVEHWARKAGRALSTPPQMVEDEGYRAEFEQQSNRLRKLQEQKINEKISERRKMDLIQNEQQEIETKLKMQQQYASQLQKDIAEAKAKATKNAEKRFVEAAKSYYMNSVENSLETVTSALLDTFKNQVKIAFPGILAGMVQTIQADVTAKEAQLRDVQSMSTEEIDAKLNKLREAKQTLEALIVE